MIPLIPSLYQINTEGKFVMFVYLFAVPRKQAVERRESRLTYRIPVVAGSSLIVREHILYGKMEIPIILILSNLTLAASLSVMTYLHSQM